MRHCAGAQQLVNAAGSAERCVEMLRNGEELSKAAGGAGKVKRIIPSSLVQTNQGLGKALFKQDFATSRCNHGVAHCFAELFLECRRPACSKILHRS